MESVVCNEFRFWVWLLLCQVTFNLCVLPLGRHELDQLLFLIFLFLCYHFEVQVSAHGALGQIAPDGVPFPSRLYISTLQCVPLLVVSDRFCFP